MRRFGKSLSIFVSTLLLSSLGFAQQAPTISVPSLVRYGGTLKDAQGSAISSVTVGMTFAIYRQQDGGAPVWIETQNITTDAAGGYSALLGSTTATGLPSDLFSQVEQRWLGVRVQGQEEQPRVQLVSVPYALKAHEAGNLGWQECLGFCAVNSTELKCDKRRQLKHRFRFSWQFAGYQATQLAPLTRPNDVQRFDFEPDREGHTEWDRSGSERHSRVKSRPGNGHSGQRVGLRCGGRRLRHERHRRVGQRDLSYRLN